MLRRHLVAGNAQLLEGTGYPLGLRTDLLPLEVRIVAVANFYDSLTETANFNPRSVLMPSKRSCDKRPMLAGSMALALKYCWPRRSSAWRFRSQR